MLPSNWPRWIIIPIGFALAVASIGIGLILEPAVQSLAQHPEPTPTLPCLDYAAPLSGECISCHTDAERMDTLVMTDEDGRRLTIDPTQINTVHGQLGCVTCHGGTAGTDDVQAAHEGLVRDPSTRYERTCLLCHRNLRQVSASDMHIHPPHQAVLDSDQVVKCSACHGAVGHGFNAPRGQPICSMAACLDCHEEQALDVQSRDCGSCHAGPHDVAAALTCSDCHASIQTWNETGLSVHPIDLTGEHAETDCFQCHEWPNFRGLDFVCTDCHERPHDFGDDECAECHTTAGWGVNALGGHTFPTDHGGADTTCTACHPGGETEETYCFSCHSSTSTADGHRAQGVTDIFGKCVDCHPEG